jgi:GT2 family glycosyltransferase
MTHSGISVIIPAYNRATLIGQTLRSLLNQTLPADEFIVVDDGSTDSTAEAAESEFLVFSRQFSGKEKLPEFKVIRQENAGPGAARNRGLAESKGEFIHFFDSDDIAAPNKHEVQVRALQETGTDIAYGPWVKGYIMEHGEKSVERGAKGENEGDLGEYPEKRYSFEAEGHVLQQKGLPKGDLVKELLTRWSVVPHACIFRRSVVEKVGGFPKELFGTEDQMMFLRCLLADARVVHTPGTLEFYRLGDSGKITAVGHAQQRHAAEWMRFLLQARVECLEHEIEPAQWSGFRMRCWRARRRWRLVGRQDPVPKEVTDCIGGIASEICCIAQFRVTQITKKLRARVFGCSENSALRSGPITTAQLKLFPVS